MRYRWPKITSPHVDTADRRPERVSLRAPSSFIYALSAIFHSAAGLTLSPPRSLSPSLSLRPSLCYLSLPLPLFLCTPLPFRHFLFLSITSVPPLTLALSLSIYRPLVPSAPSSPALLLSCLFFSSSDFTLLFIPHPDKIYVCPPRPRWHVHTHMHRCTHPPLFFCPSYLDLYQPSSSGPLPVLLRGTQLSAEEKRRDA